MDKVLERTFECDGGSEDSYLPQGGYEANRLINTIFSNFPECMFPPYPDKREWMLVGESEGNIINDGLYTIQVAVDGDMSDDLYTLLGVGKRTNVTSHSFKFLPDVGKMLVKVYYKDFTLKRALDNVFTGCNLTGEFGVHVNCEKRLRYRDVYFTTELNPTELSTVLNVPIPDAKGCLYGALYDLDTNAIVKVKSYVYPYGEFTKVRDS